MGRGWFRASTDRQHGQVLRLEQGRTYIACIPYKKRLGGWADSLKY